MIKIGAEIVGENKNGRTRHEQYVIISQTYLIYKGAKLLRLKIVVSSCRPTQMHILSNSIA